MTLFGVDLSNNNWRSEGEIAGWLDECFHREGFSFMEHKVSEGNYYRDPYWPAVRDWCATNDVACIGYHYVTTNNAASQAQTWVNNGGGPFAMFDFEANSGNMANFWAVANAFNEVGVQVVVSYIPHWYWQDIGSPDITNVPGLISSSYYGRGDYASREYAAAGGDNGSGWNGYGGAYPVIWQFSDGGIVAGKSVDVNAFRGTADQLQQLFTQGESMATAADVEAQLVDPNSEIVLYEGATKANSNFDAWSSGSVREWLSRLTWDLLRFQPGVDTNKPGKEGAVTGLRDAVSRILFELTLWLPRVSYKTAKADAGAQTNLGHSINAASLAAFNAEVLERIAKKLDVDISDLTA